MFKISSEEELLECFREIDREAVTLSPDLRVHLEQEGGLLVKDYLTWVEPSLSRVYLVFSDRLGRPPLGVVFRRDQTGGNFGPVMCEWCHSTRSGNQVGLLTVTTSDRKRLGLNLCRDLSCKDKVTSEMPGVNDPVESLDSRAKVQRILKKMGEFTRRELF